VILLLTAGDPPLGASVSGSSPMGATAFAPSVLNATLESGPKLANTSPLFWGVVAQTAQSRGIVSNPSIGRYLNATPFVTFAYTMQSDQCNVTKGVVYQDNGQTISPCGFNVTAFKAWCSSKGSGCTSIFTLPGENNNSGEDANIAHYIVHTVGFQPTFWAIGNEPMLWTHYGIPWTQWKVTDSKTPSPVAYAIDVKNAIAAVKGVDPGAKFLGIEADCECSPTWFAAVAHIDGSQIAGVAYHTYPSTALQPSESASQFFAPLASASNITTSYATVRRALIGQCAACATLPIFVTEYNSGPGWVPSNFAGHFQNAVFLAASVAQALRANVTVFNVFNLQTYQSPFNWSLMNGTGAVGPSGALFRDLLSHLHLGVVMGVSIRTSVGNVWAVTTFRGNSESLLIVNANTSRAIDLNLNHVPWVKAGTTSTIRQWCRGESQPVVSTVSALPGSFVVPPEGILLLDYTT
jgi:hypothetical protein